MFSSLYNTRLYNKFRFVNFSMLQITEHIHNYYLQTEWAAAATRWWWQCGRRLHIKSSDIWETLSINLTVCERQALMFVHLSLLRCSHAVVEKKLWAVMVSKSAALNQVVVGRMVTEHDCWYFIRIQTKHVKDSIESTSWICVTTQCSWVMSYSVVHCHKA